MHEVLSRRDLGRGSKVLTPLTPAKRIPSKDTSMKEGRWEVLCFLLWGEKGSKHTPLPLRKTKFLPTALRTLEGVSARALPNLP